MMMVLNIDYVGTDLSADVRKLSIKNEHTEKAYHLPIVFNFSSHFDDFTLYILDIE